MPTPARATFRAVVQDDRGFKANVKLNSFIADISASTSTLASLFTAYAGIGTALQAMSNAKVVATGFGFEFDMAQEPSTETGTYQLVNQKAILSFGDGTILRDRFFVPAPVDALFLTTSQDNLIVVDPASTEVTGLQSATAGLRTAAGGTWGSQFFGGQLAAAKPRRRRVLQGA